MTLSGIFIDKDERFQLDHKGSLDICIFYDQDLIIDISLRVKIVVIGFRILSEETSRPVNFAKGELLKVSLIQAAQTISVFSLNVQIKVLKAVFFFPFLFFSNQ